MVVVLDELAIHLVDPSTAKERLQIASEQIEIVAFSPLDTYIIGCEKFVPVKCERNLKIWSTTDGDERGAF